MMKEKYGCNTEDIIVCIGPCIKQCHFEVEEDFIQKFKEEFGNIEKYYKKGKTIENEPTEKVVEKQKYYFDTTKLIIDYLMEIGIKKKIYLIAISAVYAIRTKCTHIEQKKN